MRIGIPRERLTNETRVAATPKTVEQLLKLGFTVAVESGAGQLASFDDKAFVQAGAEIVEGNNVWQSEIILKVNAPLDDEIALLNPGTTLVSFIWPAQNPELMQILYLLHIRCLQPTHNTGFRLHRTVKYLHLRQVIWIQIPESLSGLQK